jgi:demethylmenaquinone methyltransferase / 2-methoxy-6-polyprenyl-1,4-benzoquinol methylase
VSTSPDPTVESVKEQENPEFVKRTFASIAARYDFANHLLSAGIDHYWRRVVAKQVAALAPDMVLDSATGSGDLALAIAKESPGATVIASDFCVPMLRQAWLKGVPHLVNADGLALPFADRTFDVVTVAFGLRNMASWKEALCEMARVLKPGGTVFILDFSMPEGGPMLPIYRFYLHRILPALADWATKKRDAYMYLGRSIEEFPSGLTMNALMQTCGFECNPPKRMTLGVVTLYSGRTPVPKKATSVLPPVRPPSDASA